MLSMSFSIECSNKWSNEKVPHKLRREGGQNCLFETIYMPPCWESFGDSSFRVCIYHCRTQA